MGTMSAWQVGESTVLHVSVKLCSGAVVPVAVPNISQPSCGRTRGFVGSVRAKRASQWDERQKPGRGSAKACERVKAHLFAFKVAANGGECLKTTQLASKMLTLLSLMSRP